MTLLRCLTLFIMSSVTQQRNHGFEIRDETKKPKKTKNTTLKNVFFSWRNFPFMLLIPLPGNPGSLRFGLGVSPDPLVWFLWGSAPPPDSSPGLGTASGLLPWSLVLGHQGPVQPISLAYVTSLILILDPRLSEFK